MRDPVGLHLLPLDPGRSQGNGTDRTGGTEVLTQRLSPCPLGVLSGGPSPLTGRMQRGAVSTGHGARGAGVCLPGAATSLQQKQP